MEVSGIGMVANDMGELPTGDGPLQGERPFFCLLEDDALVTRVSVTTDRLLEPGHQSHVSLILQVFTKAAELTTENFALGG